MFKLPVSRPLSLIQRYLKAKSNHNKNMEYLAFQFKSVDGPHPFDITDIDLIAIETVLAYKLGLFERIPFLKTLYHDSSTHFTREHIIKANNYVNQVISKANSRNLNAVNLIVNRLNYRIQMFIALQQDQNLDSKSNIFTPTSPTSPVLKELGLTETFLNLLTNGPFATMEFNREENNVFLTLDLISSNSNISPSSFTITANVKDLNMVNVNTALSSLIINYCQNQFNNTFTSESSNWSYTGLALNQEFSLDEKSILKLVEEIRAVDETLLPTVLFILINQIHNFSTLVHSMKETTKFLSTNDGRSKLVCKYSDLKLALPN